MPRPAANLRTTRLTTRTTLCPFCTAAFATATGVTHHLERTACSRAPALNRDSLHAFVRRRDPHGVLSKNATHLGSSSSFGGSRERMYDDEATGERAWNGAGYECFRCWKTFGTLHGLNAHLTSPVRKFGMQKARFKDKAPEHIWSGEVLK